MYVCLCNALTDRQVKRPPRPPATVAFPVLPVLVKDSATVIVQCGTDGPLHLCGGQYWQEGRTLEGWQSFVLGRARTRDRDNLIHFPFIAGPEKWKPLIQLASNRRFDMGA